MAWTSAITWVAGTPLTADQLNAQVRDNLLVLGGAWTAWTPAWQATVINPDVGNGSISGRYRAVGKTVDFILTLTVGTTTSYGSGTWSFTLPPVTERALRWTFTGVARDASLPDSWSILAERSAAGVITPKADATTAGASTRQLNSGIPFTWASGDTLTITGTYEAA